MANRAQGAPQHDNAGIDLDTEAQTGLDQAPATDHQFIDDIELGVEHPPEDVQTMADEPAEGAEGERRGRARVPLEPLLQDLQLPALPEALPDAQLLEGGMSAPDSASVAEADLPTSVKALLGPMLALTTPLRAQLISALKSKDFDPTDIPFNNAAEFDQFLKSRIDQGWKTVRVCDHLDREIYVRLLKDIKGAFQKMLAQEGVSVSQFAHQEGRDDGSRNDIRSGRWYRQHQELLYRAYGGDYVKLLPYLIYSDETVVTLGGKSFHPVLITLALPGKLGRGQFAHQRIAMLPVLKPADFDLTANSPQFTAIKMDAFRESVTLALQPLKTLSWSPECFQVDGQTLQMLVLPAAYIADGLEAWKIMGLRGTGTYFPDIMFLVPREELTDPIKEFPLRNVGDTRAAVEDIKRVMHQHDIKGAAEIADRFSLLFNPVAKEPAYVTLLEGFNHTDPYRLIFPDELHQSQKGDGEHLINIATTCLTPSQLKLVNNATLACPPFPGVRLPSEGLLTSWQFAQQLGALIKVLPPALLAIPDVPLAKALASVICEYLNYLKLRDLNVHTAPSLRRLKEKRIRFQELAVQLLSQWKNFGYPKFFHNRKYEMAIDWLGSAIIVSASGGEATHKELKAAWRHTNKQGESAIDQLLDHLRKADVVRMMEDKKEDSPQRGSAQRWAVERGLPVMVKTGTLMCYGETGEGEQRQRFAERLAAQPELAGFRRCLGLFLAGLPEYDARQPDATALDTLPNTPGCMISVRSAFAVPHQKHRGAPREAIMVRASPCFGSQRRAAFDNVAIRCEDTDEDMDCWFGNVRLAFTYQEGSGSRARTRECIFVRWYNVANFTAADRHLQGSFMKLEWETVRVPGSAAPQPRFDVVELDKVIRAVYIQPHPTQQDAFFFNRYV